MRLVMLGNTGSGKRTQSQRLSQQLNISLVSTGNIFKQAIFGQTQLMIEFIEDRLLKSNINNSLILEGYPLQMRLKNIMTFLPSRDKKKH